jgi:hypothetical protein
MSQQVASDGPVDMIVLKTTAELRNYRFAFIFRDRLLEWARTIGVFRGTRFSYFGW